MAMQEIGVLWRGKEGGKASATGNVSLPDGLSLVVPGGFRFVLMPNDKRGNDSAPDWRLYLATDDQQNSPPQNNGRL